MKYLKNLNLIFVCVFTLLIGALLLSNTFAGEGILKPDNPPEQILPPDEGIDAALTGTLGAFTMIRDPETKISRLSTYPSGYGINMNKDGNTLPTSSWTWYSKSSGEALTASGVLMVRCLWLKVPRGYHFYKAYLNHGGKLTSSTTSSTSFSDSDLAAFDAVMPMSNPTTGIYKSGDGYWIGDKSGWWQGVSVIENNYYNISYDLGGGNYGSYHPNKAYYNKPITISFPTRTGYQFDGWTATGIHASTAIYGINGSTSFQWTNGSTKVKYNDFNSLRYDNGGTASLKANWTANTYSISYNLNGGTWTHSSTSYHPTSTSYNTVINIENPTRAGYTFTGWSSGGSNFSSSAEWGDSSSSVTHSWNGTPKGTYFKNLSSTNNGSVTLTANWTPIMYEVCVDEGWGSGGCMDVTYDEVFSLTLPTATGYTFAGWTASDDFIGTAAKHGTTSNPTTSWTNGTTKVKSTYFKNLTVIDEGLVSLTANWTANTYTVTLNTNKGGGSTTPTAGTASVTATYDSVMPSITIPTRAGYTFAGFYDTSATTGGTQYYTSTGASARVWDKTSNTTLYARWTANKYTVTLNKNGGSGGSTSVTATFDAAMPNLTSLPTREGWKFLGYYDAQTGGNQYYREDGRWAWVWDKTQNATLFAHWQEKTWIEDDSYYSTSLAGQGTETSPYLITSAKDLAYLAKQSQTNNFSGVYFKQIADIDLDAHLWTSISDVNDYINSFAGIYDGGLYSVRNLRMNGVASGHYGLFYCAKNAKIKNINLQDIEIQSGSASIGTVVGVAELTTIENCTVTRAKITSGNQLGGIAGVAFDSTISQCMVEDCTLTGQQFVGGILGDSFTSNITDCNVIDVTIICDSGDVVCDTTSVQGSVTINSSYGFGTVNGSVQKVMYGDASAWGNWSLVEGVNGGLPIQGGLNHIGGFTESKKVYDHLVAWKNS